jgi:hypothetical protein
MTALPSPPPSLSSNLGMYLSDESYLLQGMSDGPDVYFPASLKFNRLTPQRPYTPSDRYLSSTFDMPALRSLAHQLCWNYDVDDRPRDLPNQPRREYLSSWLLSWLSLSGITYLEFPYGTDISDESTLFFLSNEFATLLFNQIHRSLSSPPASFTR